MKDQIILYNGPNSPFGRKTKITAIVQEIEVEEKKMEVSSASRGQQVSLFNPVVATEIITHFPALRDSPLRRRE